jgi:hypothetical protein
MHQFEAKAERGKLGRNVADCQRLARSARGASRTQGLSKTLHTHRKYIDTSINPARRPVSKLTAWDLDALYATMAEAGRPPSSIRQHHAILSGALRQAVKWGVVSDQRGRQRVLTGRRSAEQVGRLLSRN